MYVGITMLYLIGFMVSSFLVSVKSVFAVSGFFHISIRRGRGSKDSSCHHPILSLKTRSYPRSVSLSCMISDPLYVGCRSSWISMTMVSILDASLSVRLRIKSYSDPSQSSFRKIFPGTLFIISTRGTVSTSSNSNRSFS